MGGTRTLEWNDDLKENMQEASKITLEQLKEQVELSEVRNRHEGYGISAEGYVSIQKAMKSVKTDMDDFLKLLQASNGAIYNANKEWFNFSSAKLEALQELVESLNGQNALLFYSFVSDKERILKTFEKSNLVVKALESAKDVELWNDGKINLLLAHPSSTAYGLNLQFGGSNIIWYGLTFNAELYIQANKRLHRRGQAKPVIVHHLLTDDTRDEGVLKVVQKKEDINNVFMDVLKVNERG